MSTQPLPPRPMPDHDAWPAFVVPWDDATPGPTDMSYLLDKPAGATGFVRLAGDHLVTGDGRRWRIWGQNLTFGAATPPTDMAPAIARHLAKYGINCIRLHHIDRHWPRGVLLRSPYPESERHLRSTRALDPEAMARLDYLIACCRDVGIYIDLNLNVSRQFTEADGVKQADWVGYAKAITYFDPRILALQKEYAQQLLEHVNPFTGQRYAEDPAIALLELVNENSIIESWVRGNLRGAQTTPFGTWGDIPPAYARDLDRLWNDWLARRYASRAELAAAWQGGLQDHEDATRGSVRRLLPEEFAAAARQRFHDEASFYAEIEDDYFREMASYLRGELGARQPIIGTRHGWGGVLQLQTTASLGITDGHCYWQHPRYGSGPYDADWSITNTAMVDAPDHSAVAQLARVKVAGMPYTCSEINEPFPNDYAAEFMPILAAYGLLQDWDGLFFFCFGGGSAREQWGDGAVGRFFNMANEPVKMAQTAMGALVFLRGDVQAARELVGRTHTADWARECLRSFPRDDRHPFWSPHVLGRLALVHRTAVTGFDAAAETPRPGEVALPEGDIVSDTGELAWAGAPADGHVLVDTPRHQAIIGRAGRRATRHLALELETPFAAVQLASLDETPIAQATRLLLVAGARVANTGMRWQDETRQSLGAAWGGPPTRIEPVVAHLTLRGLVDARAVRVQPLDACGQPKGDAQGCSREDEGWALALDGSAATVWYAIEVER